MQNLGRGKWGGVVGLLLCSVGMLFGAGVKATVNTQEVVEGNVVELQLEATGSRVAFPHISEVEGYRVLSSGTSTHHAISMMNGSTKMERKTIKRITFLPTKDVTIPSYHVKIDGTSYTTDPISIKMVASKAPTLSNNPPFSLQMRVEKKKVLVGESFMVTVYFSLRKDVTISQQPHYTAPTFSGFSVVKGEEKEAYIKGEYQVQEISYILTAQEEGTHTIGEAHVKVGFPDNRRQGVFSFGFGLDTVWKQTVSNSETIEVVASGTPSDLVGLFEAQSSVDKTQTKANKPVNMTVTIEGEGGLESFEMPEYEIDGVTVYSDEAKVETKSVNGVLQSQYSKRFVFISDKDFEIPSRRFKALDPKRNSVYEIEITGHSIEVEALQGSQEQQGVVSTVAPKRESLPKASTTMEQVSQKHIEVIERVAWWMLGVAFLVGMLVMYLLRYIPLLQRAQSYSEAQALKILYGHIGKAIEVEEMVRKLYARKHGDKRVKIDKKVLREMVDRYK